MQMQKYFEKKNQLKYQKFLVYLKIYNYLKTMSEEFRLKNIEERRNYFLEETK